MGAGPEVGEAGRERALRRSRPRPVIARAAHADAPAGGARRGSRRAGLNLVRTRETVGPGDEVSAAGSAGGGLGVGDRETAGSVGSAP